MKRLITEGRVLPPVCGLLPLLPAGDVVFVSGLLGFPLNGPLNGPVDNVRNILMHEEKQEAVDLAKHMDGFMFLRECAAERSVLYDRLLLREFGYRHGR